MNPDKIEEAARALKDLAKAQRDSLKASAARRDLPSGSSRAKITSTNARWAILAEHRDRLLARATTALQEAGLTNAER